MKRRSFFLALAAAAAVVWGTGATEARAAGMPLSSVLGKTIDFGGLDFTFATTAWTSPLAASSVTITFETVNGEAGFTLTGSFSAAAGTSLDSNLRYDVSSDVGPIKDALLTGNPFSPAGNMGGQATVTESFYKPFPTPIGIPTTIGISSSGVSTAMANFVPPVSSLTVVKDIDAIGGSQGVSLSFVGQYFSVVPEPTSMSLLGIGISSLLAFRRLFKRSTPV
jgi:hypothetical protein